MTKTATKTEVKERPILFSTPMVKAILEGKKTQTRRIVKVTKAQGSTVNYCNDRFLNSHGYIAADTDLMHFTRVNCPYGKVGDRLWCRETFWCDTREPNDCVIYAENPMQYKYRLEQYTGVCDSGHTTEFLEQHRFWKRKPSIFMPRWASRITLEITNIRVERLQDIGEEDAKAEGVNILNLSPDEIYKFGVFASMSNKQMFELLWNKINGEKSWLENPFVWVIEFKKL
jgi:hypothetical protein